MAEDVDSGLVARVLDGDLDAFDKLIVRYQGPLYNGCLRMVNDREDALDIVQTVFLKAYQNLEAFDRSRKFFSWIYRMMVNESLNLLDRRKPRAPIGSEIVDTRGTPEELTERNELSDKLQHALLRLNPQYRAAIVLRYFGDLSYRELGYVFDIPEKTVKSRLHTARRLLGDIMTSEGIVSHGI